MTAPALSGLDLPAAAASPTVSRRRWLVLALLFAATAINYIDRQAIGILKPRLAHDLGWSDQAYANIISAFQLAYAASYLGLGRLIDRIGVRRGFSAAVLVWSAGGILHGLVSSVPGFAAARIALGLGEGGYLPGCIKSTRLWFPPNERGFASGVFNAGVTFGALLTPVLVPFLTLAFGWRVTFVITGGLGLIWLAAWLLLYHDPPAAPDARTGGLREALALRATWAYAAVQFLTSPVWWFYLFWLPDFLHRAHGIDLAQMGPPLVVIYLITILGSLAGGALSSLFIRRGLSPLRARKRAMLIAALFVLPVVFAAEVHGLWPATLLVALAAAAHQAWASNMFTLPCDTAPARLTGAVSGFGGMLGAIGGMFVAQLAGAILTATHSYVLLFWLVPGAYVLALALYQVLMPSASARTQDGDPA